MQDEATFDEIVSGFYAAASGATSWLEALQPFRRAFAAFAIHLHGVNLDQGVITFSHTASEHSLAEMELDYIRTYHLQDPRASLGLRLAPNEWVNCWEHFDDAFVRKSPFYQDFLIPYGGRYVCGSKLLQAGDLHVVLGIHRGRGSPVFNRVELAACQRLARHLGRAFALQNVASTEGSAGRLGVELLTRLRAPIVLVDALCRVRYANPAARSLFSTSSLVSESTGRLCCTHSIDDRAFRTMMIDLFRSTPTKLPGKSPEKAFLRLRGSSSHTLGLYLHLLRPDSTLGAFGREPLATVMFHDPGRQVELDPFIVASSFDLTPAEARIAVAAASGQTLREIANSHCLSLHTIKSQLRAVFQKTNTSRQAELVGVLAQLPSATVEF